MHTAGFFKRLFSLFYDLLLILSIALFSTLILVLLNEDQTGNSKSFLLLQRLILIVSGPVYFCYFWMKNNGQTIGMQAWKIQMVSKNGSRLIISQCLLRCVVSLISFIPFGLGYIWIIFDKKRESWADKASNTILIDLSN
tara:strand:+ start:97098 stop:97517 length:420 start_codon:yes stop_codon:yes gene_type:complete